MPRAVIRRGGCRPAAALCSLCVLGLHGSGCADADEPASLYDPSPAQLAQVLAPNEAVVGVDAPVVRSNPRGGASDRSVVPIEVGSILGTGCTGTATPSSVKGRLDIAFTHFTIRFDAATTFGLQTLDCQIQLKIYGAEGYRYVVQSIGYFGIANWRTAATRGTLEASYFWSGRAATMRAEAKRQWNIPEPPGPHSGRFERKHELSHDEANWSRCITRETPWDAVTMDLALTLISQPVQPAEFRMSFLSTELVGQAAHPGEGVTAPLVVDLAAEPCPARRAP